VSPPEKVIVVGAGMVGVCGAAYLQRQGYDVTLIDRGAPGEGCSLGNSGGFGVGLVAPLTTPGLLLRLPRLLLDPRQPLSVAPSQFVRLLPWFVRFLANSRPGRVAEIAAARHQLSAQAFAALDPLLDDADARHLVRRDGMLFVYESRRSLERARYGWDIARRFGVKVSEMDGAEARDLEPALGSNVRHGVLFPDNGHTTNPLRLVQVLARRFTEHGGTLLRESVVSIHVADDGKPRVETSAGTHVTDAVILAAGAWSRRFAAALGCDTPVVAERGYHAMIPTPGVALRAPVTLSDRNVVLTPMEEGLRITGISEFAALDAPPNDERADRIARQAGEFLPDLETAGMTRWMGPRPSTPDSLPFIGPAPRHRSVYFAFGHSHMGLAWAAVTAKVIAEMVAGQPPSLDCTPYRPDRFRSVS
jgi:D-amino-acid dehydrogenase